MKANKKTQAHIVYKLSDGTRVPGVTTVVNVLNKPALINWANKMGLAGIEVGRYVDNLADIGTLAHAMVVAHLKDETVDTDDYSKNQIEQAEWACKSFFDWMKSHEIDLLWAERPLVSENRNFGGTPDIYAIVDGVRELIDLKSGSGIYDEHKIQVAGGYSLLLEEHELSFEKVRILNIPRTNNENWAEVIIANTELFQDIFLACLDVYNLQKKLKGEVVYPRKHK